MRSIMNPVIYLFLCLVHEVHSISIASKDHSLDYYPFPAETKNSVVTGISYHDTDIEDAEEDDEDYNEEGAFRNADDDAGKLKFDPKISASVQGHSQSSSPPSIVPNGPAHGTLQPSLQPSLPPNLQPSNPASSPTSIAEGAPSPGPSTSSTSSSNSTATDLHPLSSVIPSNSTAISNNLPNATTTKQPTSSKGSGAGQLIVGLQLSKGLANTTRRTGQSIELRCVFRCTRNAAGEKCDLKPSNVKWTKNESPLKNQKNKVEITFVRRKNKDIVSKLNIYKLDTHDRGFYKCLAESKHSRQVVESVGVLQINDEQEDTLDDAMKIETAIRANFDGLDDGSPLNPGHYEPSLTNLDLFPKPENKLFGTGLNSMDYLTVGGGGEQCVAYRDEICAQYLSNQTVLVQSAEKQRINSKRMHNLVAAIGSDFKTLSLQCLRHAMFALCVYTYPLCDLDKQQDQIVRKRMMCREDCEMLEHSLCKTEYEIAKLQNLMNDGEGILPNCNRLPVIGSKEAENCVHLDLPNLVSSSIVEEEACYHENGLRYRGKVSTTVNGAKCEPWTSQRLMSIAEHPELLGGHNYCRNPDGKHRSPFCIVADSSGWKRETCDIKECGDRLLLLVSPVSVACLLFALMLASCCLYRWHSKNRKKLKKNKKCIIVPAIENTIRSANTSYSTMQAAAQQRLLASLNNSSVNLFPNSLANHPANDLNLLSMNKYGLGYLPPSSNIELNSLLANSNDYQADSCYQMENGNLLNSFNSFQNAKNMAKKKLIPGGQPPTSSLRHYPLESILFLEELGQGAFGMVFKGELTLETDLDKNQSMSKKIESVIPIAIKTLKENANSRFKLDFKREAELMADLQHPNIVSLLGVCFDQQVMCMIFEYMSNGDLHRFLLNHSPMTNTFMPISSTGNYSYPNQSSNSTSISNFSAAINILSLNDLLFLATQIAAGMEYLSQHHYVHRDLASRNCLVADHLTVKIADFGLSRDIYSQDYYRVQSRSLLPVRWMPTEAILFGKFSTESDVWSFGVLLYEIFSYGCQPYYGKNNQEVIEMIKNRELLGCPEMCPINVYNLMLECFAEQPCKRPSFTEIHSRLRNLKAVYSNSCVTSSSMGENNLNTSAYEVFDQAESNNNLTALNMSMKSRNERAPSNLDSRLDSSQVMSSNSCGNLLHQHNSDPTSESMNESSPCTNKLSIFKQSKTVDKNLNSSEQYQQPLTFNHYKNCKSPMVSSTGNLNCKKTTANLSGLAKNFTFGNNIQRHIKNLNSSYKETFKSNSNFKLSERKS